MSESNHRRTGSHNYPNSSAYHRPVATNDSNYQQEREFQPMHYDDSDSDSYSGGYPIDRGGDEHQHTDEEPLVREAEVKSKRKKKHHHHDDDNEYICDCGCCQCCSWPQCGRRWFVRDQCGFFCAMFTWMLLVYAYFVVMFVMLIPSPQKVYSAVNIVVFNFGIFLALSSHLRAMFTDPGTIPKGNATEENIAQMGLRQGQVVYKCPKCSSIKPIRAHHCSVCKRCIKKMDHHCPWVNNCIGENNQKYFVLFTFYIMLISFHALIMVIYQFVVCVSSDWKGGCDYFSPPATVIFMIFLAFEGLLFGIFTAVMFGSQVSAICSDETGIESLKREEASWERNSCWDGMRDVFGREFSLHWFWPLATPDHIAKQQSVLYTV